MGHKFLTNKYVILAMVAGTMTTIAIAMLANTKFTPPLTTLSPTPSPITTLQTVSVTTEPTSTPISPVPTATPSASITPSLTPTVSPRLTATPINPTRGTTIPITYEVTKTQLYGEAWAVVEIQTKTSEPMKLVLKKETTTWKIVLGPGTTFRERQLRSLGAPETLINEIGAP